MRVSYIELKNYRRFRELKLQFPDGIIGVLGLNGVGKSTMIEAIAWAMFGNVEEVVRTSRESVKRAGTGPQESCKVILEFELGGAEYRITREMGGKNLTMKAELRTKEKVLAEGDKYVKQMVEKLIGMDHKSFFISVFARQKELNALQNEAPGNRKKVVLRMLRIDGVDGALTEIRADARDTKERIAGSERMLLTEDGREKQKVYEEKVPDLKAALARAKEAEGKAGLQETKAQKEFDAIKKTRDELKKDFDAYNSAASDLKAKEAVIAQLRDREKTVQGRVTDAEGKLKKLPALEKEEDAWSKIESRRKALEQEKSKDERARHLRDDLAKDQKDGSRRKEDLEKLRAGLSKLPSVLDQVKDSEEAKAKTETERADLSLRVGELRARAKERREASEKDGRKLDEIRAAGHDGLCPTCERTLQDAYDLLVSKLEESSAAAAKSATELEEHAAALQREIQSLAKKEEALRKKRGFLDQELTRLRQLETSVEGKESELNILTTRMSERRRSLEELGEIRFSKEEYDKVLEEYERLREAHDEYTKLRTLKGQLDNHVRDLGSVRDSISKHTAEERQYKEIVKSLEPRKVAFDSIMKEFDEKTSYLDSAKAERRRLVSVMEKAEVELDRTTKELDEIRRLRKSIEADRKRTDDLAMLQEVVANFKDSLIARVAPALAELTSRGLEAMTDGKYSLVELDEGYEMQIDDQGTMYPIHRFSGGEADLANLSLRLAISSIIADRTGASPINLLILDEIFGSQDPTRKRSVMTALTKLSGQFRQIFLITHIEDVKDTMNYVIRVEEQEDGTSRAELAA